MATEESAKKLSVVMKGSLLSISQLGVHPCVTFILALLTICSAPPTAHGGYLVGLEIVDQPVHNAAIKGTPRGAPNLRPYDFFNAASPFAAVLSEVTASQFQDRIAAAVQAVFHNAQINLPGEILNIDIVSGPVDASLGTIHHIGNAEPDKPALAGVSLYNGATTRPDLALDTLLTNNGMSATVVDTIAEFGLTYDDIDEVINVIAGTAAQEIAHSIGVAFDVPDTPVNGVYPIMASGLSDPPLPLAARKLERRFLDLPNSQPNPDFGPGAPRTLSVTDVLVQQAGTRPVPEPSSFTLVLLAAVAMCIYNSFSESRHVAESLRDSVS